MRNMKKSFLMSVVALLLCFVMFLGTTFAWFTDSVTSSGNKIIAGTLKLDLEMLDKTTGAWYSVKENKDPIFNYEYWEPGYTNVAFLKVENEGNLALKWQARFISDAAVSKLAEVIDVYVMPSETELSYNNATRDLDGWQRVGTLDQFINTLSDTTYGYLTHEGDVAYLGIALHMQEDAGNEYQGIGLEAFDIQIVATQMSYENDSFGPDYDNDAQWPEGEMNFEASQSVANIPTLYGELTEDVIIRYNDAVYAILPAGVKLADGVTELKFTGKSVENGENIILGEGDSVKSYDIHIEGIHADNQKPITVHLGAIAEKNLNDTSLKLFHEDALMTRVTSIADFEISNQYTYNPDNGVVVIYVNHFSVFSAVETTASKWEDATEADISWYNDEEREFTLNDVADFLGFRNLVDGGNTFEGKTVILATDIDLSNKPFDPIGFGYWYEKNVVEGKDQNTVFMGTFDGGNHTIYNLYENCWELDHDKENYSTYTYSTAGAGLFASIKNATIKNLAVSGAEIVFECVDMGIIVGYAQGECHFENIVVTNAKIANYNRYTGGLVGEVSYGVDNNGDNYSHTFKNITIDSTVTVSGLWGSFGCGMGGVIGGKWGDAIVKMENVVSAPTMDVYNDVVSAYQWYAFRGCGMLIGHTEEPYSDGRHSGNATADFLTCENVNVYYGDWTSYHYYEFENQDNATGRNYPWVRAEEGNYCDAFSNIRYGVPTHTVDGVTIAVSELSPEELEKVATDHVVITFDQLYGADRGMYGTNKHEGVNVSYKSPKTYYIKNNVGWKNLTLHYIYEIGEETWTTVPDGVELVEFNGVYRIDLPVGAKSFTITADGDYRSKEFIVSELTEKETYLLHEHEFVEDKCTECGATKVDTWKMLTNETELKVGDYIVFVYEKGKMELSSFSTTETIYGIGNKFDTLPNGAMIFEVVKGSVADTIAFKNGDKYLYWNSGNSLSLNATLNSNTSWTVSIDESGNAAVLNAADNTRKLQWNASSPRFACYTSSQSAISIYVKVDEIQCGKCVMEVIDQKDASCGIAGYTTNQCSVCGKVETTTTDALAHDYTGENPYICLNNCGIHNLPESGSTITIADAKLIAETGTNNKYIITGVITSKPSDVYGATDIKDSNGETIAITIIKSIDGEIRYDSFITKPVINDTISVLAKIEKDSKGNAQLTDAWMVDHVDTNNDGVCDYCGTAFNTEEITDSLKVVGTSGSLSGNVITWTQNGIIVSNAKAGSSTPIRTSDDDHYRVYKSSKVTISVDNAIITKVVITCTSSYINGIKNGAEKAGYNVTVDGLLVTIIPNESVSSIEFTASEQARMTNVDVTYTTGTGNEGGETPDPETPAEPTTLATFEFGANGSASHVDGNDYGTSKSFTSGTYTLALTGMSKVYGPAYDAKGNSCIKLGTSKVAGKFSFTVPENVTEVVIYVAGYKDATSTNIKINGQSYTVKDASNNGAYTAITIDTTTTKTITFESVTYRCMINTIKFIGTAQ